jgi:hypothetical protein
VAEGEIIQELWKGIKTDWWEFDILAQVRFSFARACFSKFREEMYFILNQMNLSSHKMFASSWVSWIRNKSIHINYSNPFQEYYIWINILILFR